MSAAPVVVTDRRACVCCGSEATPKRRVTGEPNIMSVSLTVYRRGNGKSAQRAAGSVAICEDCFNRVVRPFLFDGMVSGRRFLAALRKRLSVCYSAMLEDDSQ